jgi:hypothetical protein
VSFIVRSLELLVQSHQDQERERREKEQAIRPARKADGAPPTFRCRVCALESADGSYCPTCLADTMEVASER